jgi:hypothetical protein
MESFKVKAVFSLGFNIDDITGQARLQLVLVVIMTSLAYTSIS